MFHGKFSRLRKIMINIIIAMCGADVTFAPELREDAETKGNARK
ncbi:hypothetical protein SAMN05445504_7681 [Burkholderia sp. CF099]|jgi:hypothetical protein|nr:hypothetical protein SAMN05445504_7681 [Burkholderia sp. CF099]